MIANLYFNCKLRSYFAWLSLWIVMAVPAIGVYRRAAGSDLPNTTLPSTTRELVNWTLNSLACASCYANSGVKFTDLLGKNYSLKASPGQRALVVIFVTTDCPIANSYQPSLARLHEEFQNKGFEFILIHEGPNQTTEKLKEHAKEYAVPFSVALDIEHSIARQSGATKTPEAIVFGRDGAILYQGRIDNLYQGFGKKRAAVTREDLRIALRQIDSGESVSVPKTEAVGCLIELK